jgi:hypothetical protein
MNASCTVFVAFSVLDELPVHPEVSSADRACDAMRRIREMSSDLSELMLKPLDRERWREVRTLLDDICRAESVVDELLDGLVGGDL